MSSNFRINLRFSEQEENMLKHYFGQRGIKNYSGFVKEQFFRSFLEFKDDGLNNNVLIIRELMAQIEFLSRKNNQINKALLLGVMSVSDPKTKERMQNLLIDVVEPEYIFAPAKT